MVVSSKDAMHSTSQDCGANFRWRDYNRFSQNECLSFLVRTPGAIDVAFAEMPTRPQGAVIMHIGVDESIMQTWDQTRKTWVRVCLNGEKKSFI